MPPPSPVPPMVMLPVELPHPSEVQSIPIAIAASGSTFKPEPVQQVLIESECFFTEKDIGRVAIALAKRCFFGEAALEAATLYGKGATKQKLAGHTLAELRKAIETIPLLSTNTQDEKEHMWRLCLRSIAGACKELRKKNAKTTLEQPHSFLFIFVSSAYVRNSRTVDLSALLFNFFLRLSIYICARTPGQMVC